MLGFLLNNYLTFWQDWPGIGNLFSHLQWFGAEALSKPLPEGAPLLGWLQILLYVVLIGLVAAYVSGPPQRGLRVDAANLSALSAFIIRAAFWSVLLIGIVRHRHLVPACRGFPVLFRR